MGPKPTRYQKTRRALKPMARLCLECDKPFTAIGPVQRLCSNCRSLERPTLMPLTGRTRPVEQAPLLGGYLGTARIERSVLGNGMPDGEVIAAGVMSDFYATRNGKKAQAHQQANGHRQPRAVEVPGQLAADERTYRADLEARIAAGDANAAAEYYARYAARLVVYRGQRLTGGGSA